MELNFGKLTNNELDEFLSIHIPHANQFNRDEKIIQAQKLFNQLAISPNPFYTFPVVDLYLAETRITKQNEKSKTRYEYLTLLNSSLDKLAPLFNFFELENTEKSRQRLIHILDLKNLVDYQENLINNLPEEVLQLIIERLPDDAVPKMCSTYTRLQNLCESNTFWKDQYIERFGQPDNIIINTVFGYDINITDAMFKQLYMYRITVKPLNIATRINNINSPVINRNTLVYVEPSDTYETLYNKLSNYSMNLIEGALGVSMIMYLKDPLGEDKYLYKLTSGDFVMAHDFSNNLRDDILHQKVLDNYLDISIYVSYQHACLIC